MSGSLCSLLLAVSRHTLREPPAATFQEGPVNCERLCSECLAGLVGQPLRVAFLDVPARRNLSNGARNARSCCHQHHGLHYAARCVHRGPWRIHYGNHPRCGFTVRVARGKGTHQALRLALWCIEFDICFSVCLCPAGSPQVVYSSSPYSMPGAASVSAMPMTSYTTSTPMTFSTLASSGSVVVPCG